MGSRFVPVTDPDKAWEYRQAGLLYWRKRRYEWRPTKLDLNREESDEVVKGTTNQYAILVEHDDEDESQSA